MKRIYRYNKTLYGIIAGFRMTCWMFIGKEERAKRIIYEHMNW